MFGIVGLVAVVVFHELSARRLPAVVGKEGEQDPPNDSKREFDGGHEATQWLELPTTIACLITLALTRES